MPNFKKNGVRNQDNLSPPQITTKSMITTTKQLNTNVFFEPLVGLEPTSIFADCLQAL